MVILIKQPVCKIKHTGYLWFTIPKNLLHLPTFAYYHQDIIVHIQVAHQQQEHLMLSLNRVWFSNFFQLPNSQCGAYNRHWYKHQCCFCVDCILQILFSSYLISIFLIISYRVKYRKHFNQFTMLLLLYVILCYEIFFPLIFPILRFMKANGRM